MQLKELNTQGYEVILVSSGAVGLGRQRLRYRKLVNSRYLWLPFSGKKFCRFLQLMRFEIIFERCFYVEIF